MLAILLTPVNRSGGVMARCSRWTLGKSVHPIDEINPSILCNFYVAGRKPFGFLFDDVQQHKEVS
jgi:hypothetical protein